MKKIFCGLDDVTNVRPSGTSYRLAQRVMGIMHSPFCQQETAGMELTEFGDWFAERIEEVLFEEVDDGVKIPRREPSGGGAVDWLGGGGVNRTPLARVELTRLRRLYDAYKRADDVGEEDLAAFLGVYRQLRDGGGELPAHEVISIEKFIAQHRNLCEAAL